jgi:ArsR family transcriptional regulator, arsenate/arsenite/antimonite-responsive transcriptional repressor / arsenate reductase (thioredoxin)
MESINTDRLAILSHPQRLALHQTYGALHNRIMAFSALSFEKLDRGSLQKRVDKLSNETVNRINQI